MIKGFLLRLPGVLLAGMVAFVITAAVSDPHAAWSNWDAGILACGVLYIILTLRRPRPRDDLSHVLVGKSRLEWVAQARAALDRLEKVNGKLPEKLIDAADVDFEAFVSLVEALDALEPLTGKPVSEDLKARAGLLE